MTDTKSKEVEELAKDLQEYSDTQINLGKSKYGREKMAEWFVKKGYTKRPQDNNLVPLDVKKLSVLLCAHRGGHP